MVAALVDGYRGLVDDVADEEGAGEQRERVEQLVHLRARTFNKPSALAKTKTGMGSQSGALAYHRVRDVRVRRPDVTLHEQGPEI